MIISPMTIRIVHNALTPKPFAVEQDEWEEVLRRIFAAVKWTYCPECGSTEIRYEEGDHKQCAVCHQEWFADIDYTDVVQKNLSSGCAGRYMAVPSPDEHG
jgi:hypothetical protein